MPSSSNKSEPPSPHLFFKLPRTLAVPWEKSADAKCAVLRQAHHERTFIPTFVVNPSNHAPLNDFSSKAIPTTEYVRLRTRRTQEEN